jgi:hypothetical protein
MASAPPSAASAGDKRKAAAEEKDPDFDLVRGLFLKSAKIRCPCLKPPSCIFMSELPHCHVMRKTVKN